MGGGELIAPETLINDREKYAVVIGSDPYYDEIKSNLENNNIYLEDLTKYDIRSVLEKIAQAAYFDEEIIKFCDDEVFVDVGSLDFGNSEVLLSKCKTVKKIIAFEPDSRQFPIVVDRAKIFPNTTVYPYGLWNKNEILRFSISDKPDSSTLIGDPIYAKIDSNVEIEARRLDDVVQDEKVTFIKMDIEGSELNALIGAREIIIKNKPKLAICIYHKNEDIIDIPLYIKSLNPSYKFYIRHYSIGDLETVLYAV